MARRRFGIRDLLVVTAVIAILFALGTPLVLQGRATARRMQCADNMKQIMLSIHNYYAAFSELPTAMSGTEQNGHRLSGLGALTPFNEAQRIWEELANPSQSFAKPYPAMGPALTDTTYPVWKYDLPVFRCPTDRAATTLTTFGRTNYAFCIGDDTRNIHGVKTRDETRGMFSPRVRLKFRDVLDGLSNTIAIGEIASMSDGTARGQFVVNGPANVLQNPAATAALVVAGSRRTYVPTATLSTHGRGGHWADGAAGHGLFQTILPPGGPSVCVGGTIAVDGLYSATSRHPGGLHIGMGDGAVKFITETIDVGNTAAQPPDRRVIRSEDEDGEANTRWVAMGSPYGLWGALGTRMSKENIYEDAVFGDR